jgi:hypothetical protein
MKKETTTKASGIGLVPVPAGFEAGATLLAVRWNEEGRERTVQSGYPGDFWYMRTGVCFRTLGKFPAGTEVTLVWEEK